MEYTVFHDFDVAKNRKCHQGWVTYGFDGAAASGSLKMGTSIVKVDLKYKYSIIGIVMPEISPHQRAATTKRNRTRDAFLDAVTTVFTDSDYQGIKVEHVANYACLSIPTFYNTFSSKSAWGAAVLDRHLDEALGRQAAAETGSPRTPRDRVLGHLVLLSEAAQPLAGITKALVDERTESQMQYSELLPRYYSGVTGTFRDGQEQRVFRADIEAAEMADFTLDSLAVAYAVHLDNPASRTTNLPSMILGGLLASC